MCPGVRGRSMVIVLAVRAVIGVLVWQAITTGGSPDPTAKHLGPAAAVLDTGILAFREGLEFDPRSQRDRGQPLTDTLAPLDPSGRGRRADPTYRVET